MGLTRPGFSVYLPLGFPSPRDFPRVLEALAPCVDFFEVGLPSTRPKYDGPTVRRAHRRVLQYLSGHAGLPLDQVKEALGKPFALMAYYSDHQHSLGDLISRAGEAGASCILFPDLLFDHPGERERYERLSHKHGLGTCYFASSRFPHRLLSDLAAGRPLFIYLGLQPATGVELPVGVERNVRLARRLVGDSYLLAGFAVRGPEAAVRLVKAGADAVVVGSAVIRALETGGVEEAIRLACGIHRALHWAG